MQYQTRLSWVLVLHALQLHAVNGENDGGLESGNGTGFPVESICHGIVLPRDVLDHAAKLLKDLAPL